MSAAESAAQRSSFAVLLGIALVILIVGLPVLTSGGLISDRGDATQYYARHHHLRTALLDHGVLAQRSHLLGGGYPVIGDPEDPTFNPLSLLTIGFGEVMGLKLHGLLAMFLFGAGIFLLLHRRFDLDTIPAAFAGLTAALSLWVPVRMWDGNPNETIPVLLPLLILIWSGKNRGGLRIVAMALLFGVMLSDGKLSFVTGVWFLGMLSLLHLIPGMRSREFRDVEPWRPLMRLSVALVVAFGLFQFRIQPALEVVNARGGLGRMELWFHADHYSPETINAYSPMQLAQEAIGWVPWFGNLTSVCVGPAAVLLGLWGVLNCGRRLLPWVAVSLLGLWLCLAHHAPVDLFRLFWELPVFSAIDAPGKYFSFSLVMAACLFAGLGFQTIWSRTAARGRIVLAACALFSLAFLGWNVWGIHGRSYTYEVPGGWDQASEIHAPIKSRDLPRGRFKPINSNTYLNLRRGVGTIDWYTGIPLEEIAKPRVTIESDGAETPNPAYVGEAWWKDSKAPVAGVEMSYHWIRVSLGKHEGGTLVINQNHHKDWSPAVGASVTSDDGLLEVKVDPSMKSVTLNYSSAALFRGVVFSALTGLLLVFVGWFCRKCDQGGRLGRVLGFLTT